MRKKLLILSLILVYSIILKGQIISQVDRFYGLSKFWQEANYNFAYFENIPNIDFDSLYKSYLAQVIKETDDYEYYKLLQKFCAELKDGHTNVYLPKYLRDTLFYPPISIRRIQQEIYVINVGKSYVNTIPRGSKITKVNGVPVLEYLNSKVYPYLTGPDYIVKSSGAKTMLQGIKGNDITITIEKPDGFQEEIAIKMDGNSEEWYYPIAQNRNNKIVEFEQLDNNIGYLAINSFGDSLVLSEFKKILPKLYDQKGLIIDVRRNGGGSSNYAHEITKYLTDKTYFFGEQGSTRKHLASHKAWGAFADSAYASSFGFGVWKNKFADYFYGNVWEMEQRDSIINDVPDEKLLMPLVVLISNNTASATEDFLIGLDYLDRGVFIGQKTFGSTGQPIFFSLPNGGRFRICTRKCTYPDGRKFIGIGIKPDIEIEPNLQYYLSDEDIVLDKGIEYLIEEIKKADNNVYKK